ncbi:MAG: spherulation-specific family 4 protein [Thaumarchaeota archaeon]|nr:spherulation-specific family 4 protein [Nitrososphaerota archaeon]
MHAETYLRSVLSIATLFVIVGILVLYPHHDAFGMSSSGLIIPLYSYPGTIWDQLIQEKNTHDSVPIIAIINPANGPGIKDENYVTGVQNLQNAGITVVGYVDTRYGTKNVTSIESEINSYKDWYGVNGIFFDAMSNIPGNETYYKQINNYTKSLGLTYTIGNPGSDTLPSYVGTVDNIVIHDAKDLPPLSLFDGWHKNFTKSNFSFVSYDVNDINATYVQNATKYVQYLYVTNLNLPNPFLSLPSYIDKIMSSIENGKQDNATVSIIVNTYSDDDKPLNGLWATIKSDKNTTSGFSPFSLSVAGGHQYAVDVANYGNYTFDHWDDGTTANTRLIVPTQNVTLTAYFQTGQNTSNQTNSANILNQTNSSNVSKQTNSSNVSNQTTYQYSQQKPTISYTTSPVKNIGSIIVSTTYPDGDRADYTILSFKIYQDTNQTLYRQIDTVSGNPFYIGNLPLNHRYKVEVFVNSMCADIEYANLEKSTEQLKMSLPLPVGMRLNVLYNDGFTPIYNATVNVMSQDNKTWAASSTDQYGETTRLWLEPTNTNTHYVVGVKLGKNISYTYSPVFLYPGYATVNGYDQEIKITTPWPSTISSPIDVKVYDAKSKPYSIKNGKLNVGIFDDSGNKIDESQVNPRGEAVFTNLKVGEYTLRVLGVKDGSAWGSSHIVLDGTRNNFAIYETPLSQNNQTSVASTNPIQKASSAND